VDLTATIFGGSTACKSFANTIPSTVTGNSDTADYKDTILSDRMGAEGTLARCVADLQKLRGPIPLLSLVQQRKKSQGHIA